MIIAKRNVLKINQREVTIKLVCRQIMCRDTGMSGEKDVQERNLKSLSGFSSKCNEEPSKTCEHNRKIIKELQCTTKDTLNKVRA